MAYIASQQQNTGSYVQSTSIWDVSRLYEVDVNSPEFKDLLVRLYQQTNNIAMALNTKDSAYYLTEEFQPGQVWFNSSDPSPLNLRPTFRTVVDIGVLGAGLKSVAHGISIAGNSNFSFTKIQGAASRPSGNIFVPLPHANGGAADIIVTVNNTNVNITNNSGITFTFAYIILEYLKN